MLKISNICILIGVIIITVENNEYYEINKKSIII